MECLHQYFYHNQSITSCNAFNESVTDTGLSVYEIIRVEQGIPLFLDDHLERLFTSMNILNLEVSTTQKELRKRIRTLIEKNKVNTGKIKLIIHFNQDHQPREKDVLIYFTPYYFPTTNEYQNGVSAGFCRAIRTHPNAKVLNIEARKKANNVIAEAKVFEVLLMDQEGFISEGSRSNVFFIHGDTLYTPNSANVLQGITRKNILRLCQINNIPLIEQDIRSSDLNHFDAAFLSGTSLKVLPLKNIEDFTFDPRHKTLQDLMRLYNQLTDNYIESNRKKPNP
ncbi:MAG: aminotransferase class IV [Bacteroidales bacterium]|nr:aminotransferase class IV [Bacteroidales bacterium]